MRKVKRVTGEVKQGRDGRAEHDRAQQGRESWKREEGRQGKGVGGGRLGREAL